MQIGYINFGKKLTGKRSVGKPHAAFDVEGDGNGARLATAPLLDPTLEKELSVMEVPYSAINYHRLFRKLLPDHCTRINKQTNY